MQRGKELTLKLSQVANWRELRPMKLSLRETPHLVLEPTNRCNLHCRICYNLYRDYTKTLDEVKADIDLGLRKRNLETVSILGGEPTLHPELPEIVAHIRQRNLYCEMLTNGLVFLEDPADVLLDRLIRAGISRIVVHVDPGQSHVRADPAAVCAALFDKLERKRVWFGISITIYPENQGSIAALMKRYARFRFFDGILATLTRDVDRVTRPDSAGTGRLTLETEYYALSRELGVEPVSYLPTSLDDQDISWLIYFYYINARTGQAVSLSPRLNRLLRRAYRRLTGRQLFGMAPNPRWFAPTFLGSLAAEFLLHPGSLTSWRRLLHDARFPADLRFQYIVIQQGPEFNLEKNQVQMCYHCPDATIREGKLTPVCVADRISPLPTGTTAHPVNEELRRAVYAHLEQD